MKTLINYHHFLKGMSLFLSYFVLLLEHVFIFYKIIEILIFFSLISKSFVKSLNNFLELFSSFLFQHLDN